MPEGDKDIPDDKEAITLQPVQRPNALNIHTVRLSPINFGKVFGKKALIGKKICHTTTGYIYRIIRFTSLGRPVMVNLDNTESYMECIAPHLLDYRFLTEEEVNEIKMKLLIQLNELKDKLVVLPVGGRIEIGPYKEIVIEKKVENPPRFIIYKEDEIDHHDASREQVEKLIKQIAEYFTPGAVIFTYPST